MRGREGEVEVEGMQRVGERGEGKGRERESLDFIIWKIVLVV